MKQFVLGVVVGGAAGFGLAFVGEAGKSAWQTLSKGVSANWRARRAAQVSNAEAARSAAQAAKSAHDLNTERGTLERERIGAQFRKRYTATDSGTVLTVIGLGDPDWRTKVLVEEVSPPERTSTEFDSSLTRVRMDWELLREAAAVQRHRTARLIVGSHNDADGWVEFERMENE